MSARILVVDDSPTIRKVVASILEARQYQAVLASDGQHALDTLETEAVDLILLDFVMPRMNGYQFCRELRASDTLKDLPVVLMSAKGDKIRGQFVQQTGAIDAITKPFDARSLVAVVEGALKKKTEGRTRTASDIEMPEEEPSDVQSSARIPVSDNPSVRRLQITQELVGSLEKLLAPEIAKIAGLSATDQKLRQALARAITPEAGEALANLLGRFGVGGGTRQVLSGDISVISIAEILQLLHLQRQTGALTISTRQTEITLFVGEGAIDFASHRGLRDEFLLGRYLAEAGVIEREKIQSLLQEENVTDKLLGELLIEKKLATEAQVRHALEQQTSELLYEVVRWKEGRFNFLNDIKLEAAEKAKLGMSTGALVMEGFRRVDEWRLIEGSFDFEEVLYRDQAAIENIANSSKLTKQELSVLEAIDGERTVAEIVDEMGGSSFELCKILYQFLNSRLVRRKQAA